MNFFRGSLPSGYEIRPLEPRHLEWAAAIVSHSNLFYSPVWSVIHCDTLTATTYDCFREAMYLVRHQIESGHSLGVFDSEYVLKRDESVAEGGKLYWDLDDPSADGDKLLEQMDFPLVSVALAYDGINPLDPQRMAGLMACLPAFSAIYRTLTTLDKRDPESWKPKAAGEVLVRNATSTRHEYEGQGVMKNMARAMMFAAAEKGFRGIEIVCLSDAVTHVWSHPPEPFRGEIVCQFHTATFEEQDEEGNLTNPFHPASQMATKVYCHLR